MSKRLILCRHAKSSWKQPELDDHDRPLNKRGKRDTSTMANFFAQQEPNIQAVFSSTAVRAYRLADALANKSNAALLAQKKLYTFSSRQLLMAIYSLPNEIHHCAVVAHNPAITQTVNKLTKQNFENIPTSGMVALQFSSDTWNNIEFSLVRCDYFQFPKNVNTDNA